LFSLNLPTNALSSLIDKDGYLTEPELASLFAELNVKCTSEEVSKLVATLDKGKVLIFFFFFIWQLPLFSKSLNWK